MYSYLTTCLKGRKIFLDDITVEELKELGANITICREDGSDLVKNILSL